MLPTPLKFVLLVVWMAMLPCQSIALDQLTIKHGDRQQVLTGKVVVSAKDGGVMLMTADGVLWPVTAEDLIERRKDDRPFAPLSSEAIGKKLLAELPAGFETHPTAHYLICYNTSRAYAQWCGGLYERLYKGFTNFWSQRGFNLHEPEMPLVVVIFADRDRYAAHSQDEVGDGAANIIGFYSLKSNRVTMYDLTGVESLRRPDDKRGSTAQINQMLMRPQAESMVATIIHEATHQIAFNCGLQQRFADIPLWVCEGLAIYFETPDLTSGKGWRTIGALNRPRLAQFRQFCVNRPAGSLASLLTDDRRFRDGRQAADAYAEAWALNYFLIRQHPKQYQDYLELLAEKPPLASDEPDERINEFKSCFGDNLQALETEFLHYLERIR
ncbi:MAG: DUF1570 domain-containing protein [Pirellulales bacterium]|nr:DUF1570 domain-containing protein [Pirellulales bacterium]